MKDNYNKKIAPFEFDYDAEKVIPVNVNITINVIDFLKISEVDLLYVLKFQLLMVWYDYRLKYHNLKKERSLNSLSKEEIIELWIPFVVFSNTVLFLLLDVPPPTQTFCPFSVRPQTTFRQIAFETSPV